jgi:Predicted membrane protein (DUF2079)
VQIKALADSPLLRAERHAVGLIPDGVPVSASNVLGAHLSVRNRILLFPVIREANWVVVDTADTEWASSFRTALRRLREQGRFVTLYESNGVVVMRRTGALGRT